MNKIEIVDLVQEKMHKFDQGSPERIQHFTKVHSFASQIGRKEGLDEKTQFILELAAVLHDIGIRPSEEKYGYSNGKTQEELGPAFARVILEEIQVDEADIQRICYIIAHHHTYDMVDGLDYRILLEADFLVNLYENNSPKKSVLSALNHIFVTDSGRKLCETMFSDLLATED